MLDVVQSKSTAMENDIKVKMADDMLFVDAFSNWKSMYFAGAGPKASDRRAIANSSGW